MKDLVVYYSLDGNTKEAAERIAEKMNADVLQLKPINEKPKGKMMFFLRGMQGAFGVCAKLEPLVLNPEQYDRIILGTPVWAGKPTPAINGFLKQHDVKDNITALFTLSGGGDNDGCVNDLKKRLSNLKTTVALADRRNPAASENERKLNDFTEELIRGK
jgi:flavodoxin